MYACVMHEHVLYFHFNEQITRYHQAMALFLNQEIGKRIDSMKEDIDLTAESLMYNIEKNQHQVASRRVERLRTSIKCQLDSLNVYVSEAIEKMKKTIGEQNAEKRKLWTELEELRSKKGSMAYDEGLDAGEKSDDSEVVISSGSDESIMKASQGYEKMMSPTLFSEMPTLVKARRRSPTACTVRPTKASTARFIMSESKKKGTTSATATKTKTSSSKMTKYSASATATKSKATREQPSATSTSGATDTIKHRASDSKVLATATQTKASTKATKHSASATKETATKSKATRGQHSATSTSSARETSISKASATTTKALSKPTMTATQMHEKTNGAKSLASDNMEAQSVGMLRPASPTVLVPASDTRMTIAGPSTTVAPTRTRRSDTHHHGHRHRSHKRKDSKDHDGKKKHKEQ